RCEAKGWREREIYSLWIQYLEACFDLAGVAASVSEWLIDHSLTLAATPFGKRRDRHCVWFDRMPWRLQLRAPSLDQRRISIWRCVSAHAETQIGAPRVAHRGITGKNAGACHASGR